MSGKLPRSGLARDILGRFGREAGSPPEVFPPGGRAAGGLSPPAPPTGTDRVFTFADRLPQPHEEEERREALETWVTFGLEGDTYALPVAHVREILRLAEITRVPHAPFPVRGVTTVRGRVIPVVDLRQRLAFPERPLDPAQRVLVTHCRGRLIGLLVDGVRQVVELAPSRIQPTPPDALSERSEYIRGVYQLEETLAILLDAERVLLVHDDDVTPPPAVPPAAAEEGRDSA